MEPFTPHHLQTNLLPNNNSNKNLNVVNASSLKKSTGDSQSSFSISKQVARKTTTKNNSTLKKKNEITRDFPVQTQQSRSVDFIDNVDPQLSNAKINYGNSHDRSHTTRISRMGKTAIGSYVEPIPNSIWNISGSSTNTNIYIQFLSSQPQNTYLIYYTNTKTNKKIQLFPIITQTNLNDFYFNEFSITNLRALTNYEISITSILNKEFISPTSRWKPTTLTIEILTQEGNPITDLSLNPSYDNITASFTVPLNGNDGYLIYLNGTEQPDVVINNNFFTIYGLTVNTEYIIGVQSLGSETVSLSTKTLPSPLIGNLELKPDFISITGKFTPPPYNSPDSLYSLYLNDQLQQNVLININSLKPLKEATFTIENLVVNTFYSVNISTGGSGNVVANTFTYPSPTISNLLLFPTQNTIKATFIQSYGKTFDVILNNNPITSSINITPVPGENNKLTFTVGGLIPFTFYDFYISTGGSEYVNKSTITLNNESVKNVSYTNETPNSISVSFDPQSYSNNYTIKLNDITISPTPVITNNRFIIDKLNVNTNANVYISCGYGDKGVYIICKTLVSPPIDDVILDSSYNYIIANITPPTGIDPIGPYTFKLNDNDISTQTKIKDNVFKFSGLDVNFPYKLSISTGGSIYKDKNINTLPSTPIRNLIFDSSYTTISGIFTPSPYGKSYNISLSLNGYTVYYSNYVVYTKGFLNGETRMGFDISGLIVNTLYRVGISTSGSEYVYGNISTSPSTPIRNLVMTPSYTTISGNFVPSIYGNTYSVYVGDVDYTNDTTISKINDNLMSFIIRNLQVFTYYSVKISTAGSLYVIADTTTLACPPVDNLVLVARSKQSIAASFVPSPYTSYYTIYHNDIPSQILTYNVDETYKTSPSFAVNNGIVTYVINDLSLNTLYNINVSTCINSNTYASKSTLPASPVEKLFTKSSFNNIYLTFSRSVDATSDYIIYYNGDTRRFDTQESTIDLSDLLVNTKYILGISTSGSEIVYSNIATIPAEKIENLSLIPSYNSIDVSYTPSPHGTDYTVYLNGSVVSGSTSNVINTFPTNIPKGESKFKINNLDVSTNYDVIISVSGSGNVVASTTTLFLPAAKLLDQTPSLLNGNVQFLIRESGLVYFTPTTKHFADLSNNNYPSISTIQTAILNNYFSVSNGSIQQNVIYTLIITSKDTGTNSNPKSNSLQCLYLSPPILTGFRPSFDISNNASFIIQNSVNYPTNTYFNANITQNQNIISIQSIVFKSGSGPVEFGNLTVASASTSTPVFQYNTPYQIELSSNYNMPYGAITSLTSNKYDCIYLKPPELLSQTDQTPNSFTILFRNNYPEYPEDSQYNVSVYQNTTPYPLNLVVSRYENLFTVMPKYTGIFGSAGSPNNIFFNNTIYKIRIDVSFNNIRSEMSQEINCVYVPPPILETQIPSFTNGNVLFNIKNTTIYPMMTTFSSNILNVNGGFITSLNNLPTLSNGNIIISDTLFYPNTKYSVNLFATYYNITSLAGTINCTYIPPPLVNGQTNGNDAFGNPYFLIINKIINYLSPSSLFGLYKTTFDASITQIGLTQQTQINNGYSVIPDINAGNISIKSSSGISIFSYNILYQISLIASYGETYGNIVSTLSSSQTCIYLQPPRLLQPTFTGDGSPFYFQIPYTTGDYPAYPTNGMTFSFICDVSGFTGSATGINGVMQINCDTPIEYNKIYTISVNARYGSIYSAYSLSIPCINLSRPVITSQTNGNDSSGNIVFSLVNRIKTYPITATFQSSVINNNTGIEITTPAHPINVQIDLNGNFTVFPSPSYPVFSYNTQYNIAIIAKFNSVSSTASYPYNCIYLKPPSLLQLLSNSSSQFVISYSTGIYPAYPTNVVFIGNAVVVDSSPSVPVAFPVDVFALNGFLYVSPGIGNMFTMNTLYTVSIYVKLGDIESTSSTIQCAYIPTPVLISQTPSYDTTTSSSRFYIINTTIYPSSTTFTANIQPSTGGSYISGNAIMETNGNNITVSGLSPSSLLQNTNYIVSLKAKYSGIESLTANITCIYVSTPVYIRQVPILDNIYGKIGFTLLNTITNYPSVGTNFYANIIYQNNQNNQNNQITTGYSVNKDLNSGNINIVSSSVVAPFSYNIPYQISLTASHLETYGNVFSGISLPLTCIYLNPPVLSNPSSNTNTTFVIPFSNNYANYPSGSQYYVSFYTSTSVNSLITQPNLAYAPYTTAVIDQINNNFTLTTMTGNVYVNNRSYYIGISVYYSDSLSVVSTPIQCTYVMPPNLQSQTPYFINGNVLFYIKHNTIYASGTTFNSIITDLSDRVITSISNLPTNPTGNPNGNIIAGNTNLLSPNTNYNVSLSATYSGATSYPSNIRCIYLSAPALSYQRPTIDTNGNIAFNIINTTVYPANTNYTANIKDVLTNIYTQTSYINVSIGINGNVNVAASSLSNPLVFYYNKIYNIMLNAFYTPSTYGVITSDYSNAISCISLQPPVLLPPTTNGTATTFVVPYTTGSYDLYPTSGMSFVVKGGVSGFIGNATASNGNMSVMANIIGGSSPIQSNQIYYISLNAIYNAGYGSVSSIDSSSVACIYFTNPVFTTYTTNTDIYGNVQFNLLNTTTYPIGVSYIATITDITTPSVVSPPSVITSGAAPNDNILTVCASPPLTINQLFYINKPYDIKVKAKLGSIYSNDSTVIKCISLSKPVLSDATVNGNITFKFPYTQGAFTYTYPSGTSYTANIVLKNTSPPQFFFGTGNSTISPGNIIITPSAGNTIANNQLYAVSMAASIYNMNSSQSDDIEYIYLPTPILTGYVPQNDTNGNICFNITNSITNYIFQTGFSANVYDNTGSTITTITPFVLKDLNNKLIIYSSLSKSSFSYNTVYKFNVNASYKSIVSSSSENITCVYLSRPVLYPQTFDSSSQFIVPFTTGVSGSNYPADTTFTAKIIPDLSSSVISSGGNLYITPTLPQRINNNTIYTVSVNATLNSYTTQYSNEIKCVYVPPPVLSTYTSSVDGSNVIFTIKNSVNTYDLSDTYDVFSTPYPATGFPAVRNDFNGNLIVSGYFTYNTPYNITIDAKYNSVISGISNSIGCIYLETPILIDSTTSLVNENIRFNTTTRNKYDISLPFTPHFYSDNNKTSTIPIPQSSVAYTNGVSGLNTFTVSSTQFINNTAYYIGIDISSNSQSVSSNPLLFYYNKAPNLIGSTASIVNGNIVFNLTNSVIYANPVPEFIASIYRSSSIASPMTTGTVSLITATNSFNVDYTNYVFNPNTIYYITISSKFEYLQGESNSLGCLYLQPPVLNNFFATSSSSFTIQTDNTVVDLSGTSYNCSINTNTIKNTNGLTRDATGNIIFDNLSISQNNLYTVSVSKKYYGNISAASTINCINLSGPVLTEKYGSFDLYGLLQFNAKQTTSYPNNILFNGTITNTTTSPSTALSTSLYNVNKDTSNNVVFTSATGSNIFSYFTNYTFNVNAKYNYTINGVFNSYLSAISNDIQYRFMEPPTNLVYNALGGYFTFTPPSINPSYPLSSPAYNSYKNGGLNNSFNLTSIANFIPTLTANSQTIANKGLQNGSYLVSSSSNAVNAYAYNGFNTTAYSWSTTSSVNTTYTLVQSSNIYGEWLQIQLPVSLQITSLTLNNTDVNIASNITIVGSTDGSNWYNYGTIKPITIIANGNETPYIYGSYTFYKFINTSTTGNISSYTNINANVLIVGAGGCGATTLLSTSAEGQGGGGAGELVIGTYTLTSQIVNINVGKSEGTNTNGGNTVISCGSSLNAVALGGGRGGFEEPSGTETNKIGGTGGSGGGGVGMGHDVNGGTTLSGSKTGLLNVNSKANNGGIGRWKAGGGGGGGSNNSGSSSSIGQGGNGGTAYKWIIDNNYYAAGGGGGGSNNTGGTSLNGNGGESTTGIYLGGNGAVLGSNTYNGMNGVNGTGSGGGGSNNSYGSKGGLGGTGVVIFGFNTSSLNAITMITNTNSYQYYRFICTETTVKPISLSNINFTGIPNSFILSPTTTGDKINMNAYYGTTYGNSVVSNTITM